MAEASPCAMAATRPASPPSDGLLSGILSWFAVLIWLGSIHLIIILVLVLLVNIRHAWAMAIACLMLLLMVLPADYDSPIGRRVAMFVFRYGPKHFPIKVEVDDMDAFDTNRAYVFAMEPHSVLPFGMISLCHYTGYFPFTKIRALASSAVFRTPILRHLWTWLGLVPASRKMFAKLLSEGYSCTIVPGGVQECLYMEHDREVAFLKNRFGFVRLAMEAGAPLVPVFCFGQTEAYRWWKPRGKWFSKLSRTVGFAPLLFWGMFGTPVPRKHEIYVAVGKPIEVQKTLQPSKEEIVAVLEKYIVALQELFERHKDAAGYKNMQLYVY